MVPFSSAVFALFLFLPHVSSLVHAPADSKMSLDGRGHFMLHKQSLDYNPVDGGNADSIAGSRSYIPGGDDTLAASKMSLDDRGHFVLHKKSLDYNPVDGGNAVSIAGSRSYIPGGDDTLTASKMSLDGRGHFMLHKKSLDYNPVAGGNAVSIAGSRSFIPGGDDTLSASKMSLDGRGHFMQHKKSLDYNRIVRSPGGKAVSIPAIGSSTGTANRSFVGSPGGNTVSSPGTTSRSYIPGGDDMLAARWSQSPPQSQVVLESEPPQKPRPPTCLPRC
ncbi:hypothetical protein AAHA92_26288 [Salvia divinorum]|uniref:Uncharacterized protein n=1 Tax=Salvia divinorum TaxID=28513 RepID=A0ABD1GDG5_SALDI